MYIQKRVINRVNTISYRCVINQLGDSGGFSGYVLLLYLKTSSSTHFFFFFFAIEKKKSYLKQRPGPLSLFGLFKGDNKWYFPSSEVNGQSVCSSAVTVLFRCHFVPNY